LTEENNLATLKKQKPGFNLRAWVLEPRPRFLILPVTLILLGTAVAAYDGSLNIGYAVLAFVGLLLCHMSVNVLNDYFDFMSGVDLKTIKTPFSGGSGILPSGQLKPKQVLWYGAICFILAIPVGIYFVVVHGWQLIPLMVVAGLSILLYTPVILKSRFPEWSPGLGLGILPILGSYFAQTGQYTLSAFFASIPPGFLVLNLLLLNEFPDAEADRIANKKTLPITAGKRNAAIAYSSFLIATYLWIIGASLAGQMPKTVLLSLLTLPFAYRAIRGSFGYHNMAIMLPAQANNILTVLGIPLLMGIGYIIATNFPALR
jgi:1,4-dihydroxy-2-naphthoate octaprenyltransferase